MEHTLACYIHSLAVQDAAWPDQAYLVDCNDLVCCSKGPKLYGLIYLTKRLRGEVQC